MRGYAGGKGGGFGCAEVSRARMFHPKHCGLHQQIHNVQNIHFHKLNEFWYYPVYMMHLFATQILLQGDQRENAHSFLLGAGYPKDNIEIQ